MILFLGENRRIEAYSEKFPEEKAKEYNNAVWYEGKFSFFMGEDKPGFFKAFYLEEDGTIRIEYEPIPPSQPTEAETMQADMDYLKMMVM